MTDSLSRHNLHCGTAKVSVSAERLTGASINADVILEPGWLDPRLSWIATPAPATVPVAPISGASGAGRQLPAAPARQLVALPLSGAVWCGPAASRGGGAGPRVRGDHLLILLREGALTISFPKGAALFHGVRLIFVPAGTGFAMRSLAEARGRLLLIPPQMARGFPDTFCEGRPEAGDLDPLCAHVDRLAQGVASPDHLEAMREILLRMTLRQAAHPPDVRKLAAARLLCTRFLTRLEVQPDSTGTIADLARDLGCSLTELDRACQISRGRSALELVYRLRLDRAAELLRTTSVPAPRIAEDLGFASLGHFIRVFSAATGTSPDVFRRRHGPGGG